MNRIILAVGLMIATMTAHALEWVSPDTCKPNWNANPPGELVQGYRVYIQGDAPLTEIQYDVGPVTQTTCAVVGLTVPGQYEMYVTAYNSAGESGPSNIVPFVLAISAPTSPTGVSVSP